MLTDSMAIKMVQMAYAASLARKERRVKVPDPKPGGPLHKNCIAFFLLAEEAHVSLNDLMNAIIDAFQENWCKKVFRRPYIPFPVAVSPKQASRALKNLPPELRTGNHAAKLDMLMNQLSKLDKPTAMDMVASGVFTGGDDKLKAALIAKLREAV